MQDKFIEEATKAVLSYLRRQLLNSAVIGLVVNGDTLYIERRHITHVIYKTSGAIKIYVLNAQAIVITGTNDIDAARKTLSVYYPAPDKIYSGE